MKITIFNLNTWLLPFPLARDNKKRRKKIASYIKKNKPHYVTLQEVWRKGYVAYFNRYLKDYKITYNRNRAANRSGLLTLSQNKPKKTRFYPFPKKGLRPLLNRVTRRGVLKAEFSSFYIYNTHLYHRSLGKGLKTTRDELEFLKDIIKDDKLSFVCGDLNLDKEKFDELNKGYFSYVEDAGITFSSSNKYIKKWYEKLQIMDRKIDYILVHNPKNKKLKFNSEIIDEDLSDHYGIITEVSVD